MNLNLDRFNRSSRQKGKWNMNKQKEIYCTSFCNMGHNIRTGRPIAHECYIIPPKLLKAEMTLTNWDEIHNIWTSWHPLGDKRRFVKGRK